MKQARAFPQSLRRVLLASAASCLIGAAALAQNVTPPATSGSPGATSGASGVNQLPGMSQAPSPSSTEDRTSSVTSRDTQAARDQARNARPDDDDDDDDDHHDGKDAGQDIRHSIMVEAGLQAIRTRLRLTPEQERLWGPVETAARDLARTMRESREDMMDLDDDEPVDALRRMGDAASDHGDALERLADAAEPLWNALDDRQKRRLRTVLARMHERMHERMHGGMQGRMGERGRDMDDGRGRSARDEERSNDMSDRMRRRWDDSRSDRSDWMRRHMREHWDRHDRDESGENRRRSWGGWGGWD